jgi:long-chain fatty acid transport protein
MKGDRMKHFTLKLNIQQSGMAFFLCLCTLSFSAADAVAYIDGTRCIGYSAKSLGRGGIDIAIADDSTGINTNPAGMAFINGGVADANITMLFPWDIRMSNPNNDKIENKDRLLVAPSAGLVYHPENAKWAAGFSLAAPDALATDWTVTSNYFNASPLTPDKSTSIMNAYSEWIHLRLSPAVAYAVNDKLSVGARGGIDYMTLDLRAPLGRAYLDLGTADAVGFSFGLGAIYRPTDKLSIGISGETQSYMDDLESNSGDTFVKMDASGLDLGGGAMPHGSIAEFTGMKAEVSDFESPPVIGAGVSYQATDRLMLGADFRYLFWSETNEKMKIKLSGGDTPIFEAITGVDTLVLPFKWEDAPTVSVGGSYKVCETIFLNLGYNWGEIVTDDNYVNYLSPIIFDQHLTLGVTQILGKLEISAAFVHSFYNSESNEALSGVDQSIMEQLGGLPLDTELNSQKVSGYLNTISLQLSYRF